MIGCGVSEDTVHALVLHWTELEVEVKQAFSGILHDVTTSRAID